MVRWFIIIPVNLVVESRLFARSVHDPEHRIMGKKSSRTKPAPAPQPAASHASRPRKWPLWKWLVMLVAGAGAGFAATLVFDRGGRPWGAAPEGMVWIPRGKFVMGTDDPNHRFFDARPPHEVEIDGFWMDETEVTNEQFTSFVAATGYVTSRSRSRRSKTSCRTFAPARAARPGGASPWLARVPAASERGTERLRPNGAGGCRARAGSTRRGRAATSTTG